MINFNFLKQSNNQTKEKFKIHMDEVNFEDQSVLFLYEKLLELDPALERPLISFCIGTDRSTGDSLGPLVGWWLKKKQPYNSFIYGTIENPVHATNMKDYLSVIKQTFNNPLIIAIDACLGKVESIGNVAYSQGPLKPGAAVSKELPEVGDLSVSGIVNVGGFMEYFVLQNTRLGLVMNMAEKIALVLNGLYIKRAHAKQ